MLIKNLFHRRHIAGLLLAGVAGLALSGTLAIFGSRLVGAPPVGLVQGNATSGSGTSLTIAYSNSVHSGDLLVGIFRTPGGPVVKDNLNGAWLKASSNSFASIWYHANVAAGATTVTLTATSGSVRGAIADYAGVASFSPYVSGACNSGSGTAVTTGGSASVPAGDLVFAGVSTSNHPITITARSSNDATAAMGNQVTNGSGTIGFADVTSAAAGNQNAGMTLSASGSAGWNACLAAFSPAGATPTPTPTPAAIPSPSPTPTPKPGRGGANLDHTLKVNLRTARSLLHVGSVRFAHNDPNLVGDAQAVHAAGLQPIIVLNGCSVSDPTTRLTDNEALLNQMHQIFGAASIWWELGNENDLQCGLSAAQYTPMWNGEIPVLKPMFPQDLFGGPVNFQSNPAYIAYFVQNATPKPDFISWHEYTCGSTSSPSYCVQHITTWTAHISTTRRDIAAVGLRAPPIFITEYNYAPDGGVCTDATHNNATFMTQWTTTALQTLAQNNVAESYQFDTANCLPLETPTGSLTTQGQVFANFW
jgi:hypothetical protein